MIKRICVFILILLVFGFSIYHNKNQIFSYENSSLGIVADEYILDQTSVNVCWAKMEDLSQIAPDEMVFSLAKEKKFQMIDLDLRSDIQKKIQQQFSLEKVGIEFVGWNDCNTKKKADIKIFAFNKLSQEYFNYPSGRCYIGQAYYEYDIEKNEYKIAKRPKDTPGFLFLNKPWNDTDTFENTKSTFIRTALHEFGHATGLHHEHYRPNAIKDKNCWSFYAEDPQFNQFSMGKVSAYSDYDPDSIMNYCFLSKEADQKIQKVDDIKLSPQDIHTLRCVYKRKDQSKESCSVKKI